MNDPKLEETVFHAALQLPPDKRPAYLNLACDGNEPLRKRVENLLAASIQSDPFFQKEPIAIASGDENPTAITPETSQEPGSRIGRYKLREKLGEGGCGVVYVAEQEEPVRRRVALKVIKLGMDTRSVIARFDAERQALAMMDHPNIAKVLDAGATEAGRPYFVMELVRGIRITDYCDQNNLTTLERLQLFIKVCHAVQHAHQKGIIHRDLKPSNILVTLHDGVPVPKVIDFGISKATEGRLTDLTIYTELHQFIGTPAYMSPEQAEMSGLDIDTRSDIYSLGVLLYELLTGRTPFDPQKMLEAGLDEIRRTIREVEPERPSTRLSTMLDADRTATAKRRRTESTHLVSSLRGDLDWIVMKALEKDRTRRYETANGLAADLQRHLNNEPVLASPPSALYRLQKAVRRNRLAYGAAAAIALALIAGVVLTSVQAIRAIRAEQLASNRLAEVAAERDAKELALKEAEEVSTFFQQVFESPDPMRDGRTITVAENLDRAAASLDSELKGQPTRRAQLQGTLAATYSALGLPKMAITLETMARDYWKQTLGMEHPRTIESERKLARNYEDAGNDAEALALCESVATRSRKILGGSHPKTLEALYHLAVLHAKVGKGMSALSLRKEVLNQRKIILGPEHPDTIRSMIGLGASYAQMDQASEALKIQEETLEICRKTLGKRHPYTLMAIQNLAVTYKTRARENDALKLEEELITIRADVFGPKHPSTIGAMKNFAQSLKLAKQHQKALELANQALAVSEEVNGSNHVLTLQIKSTVGSIYLEMGHYTEAIQLFERVRATAQTALEPAHNEALASVDGLATAYHRIGRTNAALIVLQETVRTFRSTLGNDNDITINAMSQLADYYGTLGRTKDMIALKEVILASQQRIYGMEHSMTVYSMITLAGMTFNFGSRDEHLALAEDTLKVVRKVHGPEHSYTHFAIEVLAKYYNRLGRYPEAIALFEELVKLTRKPTGSESPDFIKPLHDLADCYFSAGRKESALKLRIETLALGRRLLEPTNTYTAHLMSDLAGSYVESGQYKDATELLQEALKLRTQLLGKDHPECWKTSHDLAVALLRGGRQDSANEIFQGLPKNAIQQWLVLAPLPLNGTDCLAGLDAAQVPNEATLRPRAGDVARFEKSEVKWQVLQSPDYLLDFNHLLGKQSEYSVAYAVCYISTPIALKQISMRLSTDDQAKVYLNGKEVYRNPNARGVADASDKVDGLELNAGLNVLVLKVVNSQQDWQSTVALFDGGGQPLKGVRLTLNPDEK